MSHRLSASHVHTLVPSSQSVNLLAAGVVHELTCIGLAYTQTTRFHSPRRLTLFLVCWLLQHRGLELTLSGIWPWYKIECREGEQSGQLPCLYMQLRCPFFVVENMLNIRVTPPFILAGTCGPAYCAFSPNGWFNGPHCTCFQCAVTYFQPRCNACQNAWVTLVNVLRPRGLAFTANVLSLVRQPSIEHGVSHSSIRRSSDDCLDMA